MPADTTGMIDFERDELHDNPQWRRVLAAYQAQKQAAPEDEGWIARVRTVEGICPDHLPQIHGKLIALGLLKFQLAGRETGICYQLSTLGRHVLAGTVAAHEELAGHDE
jgi:hypothetical protein